MVSPATRVVDAVVFDLDGVFRQWDDHLLVELEESYGVPGGTILNIAFGSDLGPRVVTGGLTYVEWFKLVEAELVLHHGDPARELARRWGDIVGRVDPGMLELLRRVRRQVPVALLSNGTTRLLRDLMILGLTDEFDHIFNTAELGVAKPDPAVFELVCGELRLAPIRTAFVDDLPVNVEGAEVAGLVACHHRDEDDTRRFLRGLGLEA